MSADPSSSAAPKIGDRLHYKCSLCGRIFGPFSTEPNAAAFADLHTSECSHA